MYEFEMDVKCVLCNPTLTCLFVIHHTSSAGMVRSTLVTTKKEYSQLSVSVNEIKKGRTYLLDPPAKDQMLVVHGMVFDVCPSSSSIHNICNNS